METKSDKATSKKFSFRKRRSSKGKKENDVPPVDLEQEATVENSEATIESDPVVEVEQTAVQEDKALQQSCGEDQSPKSDDSPPGESSKKKKSKRRSLFKRSSKKSSEKDEDGCELEVKGSAEQNGEASEAVEVIEAVSDMKSSAEQVVCEETTGKQGEVTDQSDGEGYLSLGEASEAEGAEGKDSSPESKTADEKGTKRKGFFKRGLSLKRRKSKKQTSEAKETDTQTNEAEIQTKSTEQNSETAAEINEENKSEAVVGHNEISDDIEHSKTEEENTSSGKKSPVKPPRKVSFVGPDGKKLESSDDGDSPTEHVGETGDESDEETVTAEDGPSDEETITAEDGPSKVGSEMVVVMSEDAGCSEPLTEGDDDDLTEVSSMSSSLLASSDGPDTISTSDASRLFVFTDTEDTGSRVTLTEISEESEAESKPEVVGDDPKCESESEASRIESQPEVSGEETGFESRPEATETKPENEATKLLGNGDKSEWEMVDRSYDMSVELQRVRKQTLFSVKRLCCSVM